MRSRGLVPLVAVAALGYAAGCATVSVDGVRRAGNPGIIEPVAFVIFASSTPPSFSQILQQKLSGEMRRRGIPAHFTIVSRTEDAKGAVIAQAFSDVPGAIIIAPSDGTPRVNGVVAPVYYDVRALRILKQPGPAVPGSGPDGSTPINDGTGQYSTIWRGRAYARGGFKDENLGEVASRIVARLVSDNVLRGSI